MVVGRASERIFVLIVLLMYKRKLVQWVSLCVDPLWGGHPLLKRCHPSHKLMVADVETPRFEELASLVVWCAACGCYSETNVRGLAGVCTGFNLASVFRKHLLRGRHPGRDTV